MSAYALGDRDAPSAPRTDVGGAAGHAASAARRRLSASARTLMGSLHFGLATTFAALLALFVAFWLELASPSSAMVTVLIVASPVRGMVLSKSLYRLLGTLLGGAVTFAFVELFGHASELFFLALALWIAACTAVATLLRNFRAYAAILSGYTVALIGVAAIQAPQRIFDIASARIAAITVGVACAGFVSSILFPGGAARDLAPRLRDAILLVVKLAQDALEGPPPSVPERGYLDATGQILALDDLAEFAAAESPRAAQQQNAIRGAIDALIAAVAALPAIAAAAPEGLAEDPHLIRDLERALADAAARLRDSGAAPAGRLSAARDRLALAADRVEAGPDPSLRELQLIDSLDDLVEQLDSALVDLNAVIDNRPARATVSLPYHRDVGDALRNGLRAFLGVIGAGAFCYAIGWSDGGDMTVIVAVNCSLLAITPDPFKASLGSAIAVCVAVVAAVACKFFLLTGTDGGFLELAVLVGAPLLATFLITDPRLAGLCSAARMFFAINLAPTNPMAFDLAATLNSAMATIVGAVFAAYLYRAVLPRNPGREALRVMRAVRADIDAMRARIGGGRAVAESRVYHRLLELARRLDPARPENKTIIADAVARSRGALALQRARAALASGDVPQEARDLLEDALVDGGTRRALSSAAHALAAAGRGEALPIRRKLGRASAALAEAAALAGPSDARSLAA